MEMRGDPLLAVCEGEVAKGGTGREDGSDVVVFSSAV